MIINFNTKIAALLKHHPNALEAIISISPKFEKLRNPLLRKIMAGRTSISMASKVGGCSVDDFLMKLEELGFVIDKSTQPIMEKNKKRPDFMSFVQSGRVVEMDVRPMLALGADPLNTILEAIKNMQTESVLRIINTFEPSPLIKMLEKKGFMSYVDKINDDLVETYFYKKTEANSFEIDYLMDASKGWDEVLSQFAQNTQTIDVRAFEMPQPMLMILEALEQLPENKALYVYHKRIPVFLLPELSERKFDYRIKEFSDSEAHLLIYKM